MKRENTTIKYYNKNSKKLASRYESANVSDLHQLAIKFFPSGGKLLELGCGSGRDLAFLNSQEYEVEGLDASLPLLRQAEKIHPELKGKLYEVSIPEELNLKDIRYDGVLAIAVLMHLKKKEITETFHKVYRCLKSDGRLIYSVPITRDDVNRDNYDDKGRLFLSFSKEGWIKFAIDCGFKLLKTNETSDGLNRKGVSWLSCVVEK